MSTGLVIQYVIVGIIVFACAWLALRKLMPKTTNRWLASASIHFGRKRGSRVAQVISHRLQPKAATSHSCADGCATCGACGPKKPAQARVGTDDGDTVPLHFMPLHSADTKHTS